MAALGYTQLNQSKKSIRLLTVAPGDPEGQIRCELTHADLDESPSFIALSYTWDQGGGQDEIECFGTTIQIGKNLWDFLYRFRIWDEGLGSRLWIDALCINQNDVNERNHQVGQMRALFSTATSTIAWLGETTSNSGLAYLAMSATKHCIGYNNDETRRALADLLNRPYWSRVWVIQEFLLPQHLDVWWGGYRVQVHDLRQVVWTMTELSWRCKPRYSSVWETPGRVLLHYRENYQRIRCSNDASSGAFRKMMRLQPLLQSFSASKCSLMHDRVYGLLGIVTDTSHAKYPILPDYSKSLVALFLDVLRNQRTKTSDESGQTWKLIKVICNLLELDEEDLVRLAFHGASQTEKETYYLMREIQAKFPTSLNRDWLWCATTPCVLEYYQTVDGILQSMRQVKGCMAALNEYLEFSPLDAPRIPSNRASIKAFIVGLKGRKIPSAEKDFVEHSAYDTDILKRLRQLKMHPILGEWPWQTVDGSKPHLVGFTHESATACTDRKLIFTFYNSFGHFGTALLSNCEKSCGARRCLWHDAHKCADHEQRIVGTAFVYMQWPTTYVF